MGVVQNEGERGRGEEGEMRFRMDRQIRQHRGKKKASETFDFSLSHSTEGSSQDCPPTERAKERERKPQPAVHEPTA